MAEGRTAGGKLFGDFAPEPVRLTDDIPFGGVWAGEGRPGGRSLITVTTLVALHRADQLALHLPKAPENGVTKHELVEATQKENHHEEA
ncbi:carboxymuconolactone decarboxylase family protein [Streptomyces sp. NPDC002143]